MTALRIRGPLVLHHADIDAEHRQLVASLGAVARALDGGRSTAEIERAVTDLTGFAQDNFRTEEYIMFGASYRGAEEHYRDHAALLVRLDGLAVAVRAGETVAARRSLHQLGRRFEQHILRLDKPLVDLLMGAPPARRRLR